MQYALLLQALGGDSVFGVGAPHNGLINHHKNVKSNRIESGAPVELKVTCLNKQRPLHSAKHRRTANADHSWLFLKEYILVFLV